MTVFLLTIFLLLSAQAHYPPTASPNAAARTPGTYLPSMQDRLREAPYTNSRREATLRKWFVASGCTSSRLTEQVVTRGRPPNLICSLPGETHSLIIVGAHTDHVTKGMGVVDDWSGAAILPALYKALSRHPRKHTFLFIGFTEEEKGLVGSRFFVHHLPSWKLRRIRAMVNLECLGLTPSKVWSDHANPVLLAGLVLMAHNLRVPLGGIDLESAGRDDAESFGAARVPTITIHSLTHKTLHIMHSAEDNFSAIDMADYDQSYHLVAAYLVYLDAVLP